MVRGHQSMLPYDKNIHILILNFIIKQISYNKLRNNSREIEFQLVQEEIEQIDELIKKGEYFLNWNSEGKIYLCTKRLTYKLNMF